MPLEKWRVGGGKADQFSIFGHLFVCVILAIVVASCDVDRMYMDISDNTTEIQIRGGSSGNLLSLLGTYCFDESIFVNYPGCNDTLFKDTLIITDLPGYTDCSFTIVFNFFVCNFLGLRDYSISDYQILDHDCEQFSNEIQNPVFSTIFSDFVHQFDQKIYRAIESHILSSYVNPNEFRCMQSAVIQIKFYTSSCYRYCIAKVEGREIYGLTKAACGVQCCEYHTTICFDQNDSPVVVNSGFAPLYPPFCDEDAILDQLLPCFYSDRESVSWETKCTFRCIEP